MNVNEVIHSCSNASVAQAAASSIGGLLARHLASEARLKGVSRGEYAAALVKDLANPAGVIKWRAAERILRRSDKPVLVCLRFVLKRGQKSLCGCGICDGMRLWKHNEWREMGLS